MTHANITVSILVLLDFVLKVLTLIYMIIRVLVSILVLLDFVLKVIRQSDKPFLFKKVSILVLLDFVLKDYLTVHNELEQRSFNPCFIGFCS